MKVDLSKYHNRHGHKMKRLVWEFVWGCLFRPTPRWCLNGWRRFLLKAFGARISAGVRIQGGARCWQPWKLEIGEHSWVDSGVNLYAVDRLTIGAHSVISTGAFLCTASHDPSSPIFELITGPIVVGDMAWIGARSFIMPGVLIGEGAVVGAGSVVTKDVAPWTIVAGNPAREIGRRGSLDVDDTSQLGDKALSGNS